MKYLSRIKFKLAENLISVWQVKESKEWYSARLPYADLKRTAVVAEKLQSYQYFTSDYAPTISKTA